MMLKLTIRAMSIVALMAAFGTCVCAGAAACVGTPALEGRLRLHADAYAYTQLGTWFGDRHQFECAAAAFQSALKFDPGSARLNYLSGLALYTAGHVAQAIDPLGRAVQLDPKLLQAHLILGSAHAELHHPLAAEAQWEAALKIDPNSKMALDGLARALIEQGDSAAVIAHLGTTHLDERLTFDLAKAYMKQGLPSDALAVLKQGLKNYPSSDVLTNAIITVYVQNTQYEEALHLAAIAASARPRDFNAQRTYLRVLVLNGDQALAPSLARKLLTMAPQDADILYLSGILDRVAGNYPLARTHLEKAVSLDPNYYNSRYNLGIALLQLEDFKGAKEQFEKSLELGAKEPELHFELGMALRNLGEADAARAQFKLYQERTQAQEKHGLAVHDATFAAQALAAGELNKAAELYRQAAQATPDDAQLSYKRALVLDMIDDKSGEREALEQAIKVDPNLAPAHYQLGYVDSRAGDMAAAEQQFRLALHADPAYSQAWISLAATLGMESRFPEAQEAVANALRLDPRNAEAAQLSKALIKARSQN